MWKIGSVVLHKTKIQTIQSSLRLHLQLQLQTAVWTTTKKPTNHLTFGWNLFSKNPQFLLQMYIKASYYKYLNGSLKTTNNPPIKQTPQSKTCPNTYLEKNHTILLYHPDHEFICTDSSKNSNTTARAAVHDKTIHKKALPMKSSIFTAEVCTIDLALNIISKNKH